MLVGDEDAFLDLQNEVDEGLQQRRAAQNGIATCHVEADGARWARAKWRRLVVGSAH